MLSQGNRFSRWYDRIPELSQAVRMLEKLTPEKQRIIAEVIVNSMQLHELSHHSGHGFRKLGTEKVVGLMKSKNKRRWYDKDPVVHQAFNCLYLMSATMRHEAGIKILISVTALEEAEKKSLPEKSHPSLVRAIFNRQLGRLLEKTTLVIQPGESADPEELLTDLSIAINTDFAPAPKTVDSSEDGMKIVLRETT